MQAILEAEQDNKATIKRRLGRGLNALLGGADESESATGAIVEAPAADPEQTPASDEIAVELIERNPFQPRKRFDEDGLLELVGSIRQHGILQPLLVRQHDEGYQLIAGERRLLAAQKAGMETVPCRVVQFDDSQVCEAAIEENMKRRDLNVLEKAQAFQEYLERFESTIEELAKRLSMSRSTVSNMLRLLELPDSVKDAVRNDQVSAGHARALLPLDEAACIALCERIRRERLSVRAVEEAVRAALRPTDSQTTAKQPAETAAKTKPEPSNHILSIRDQLREQFGARVEIQLKSHDSGRIVMHFGSNDDFERILTGLRRAA